MAKDTKKPAAKAPAKKTAKKIADFEIGKVNTNRDIEGEIKRLREACLDLEEDRIEKTSEIVISHLDRYNDRSPFVHNVSVLHAATTQFNLLNKFYYAG